MLHYMSLKLTIDTIVARLEASFSDAWMNTNMLKINKDKAELIIFSPKIKSGVFPSCTINFDGQIIEAQSFVKKILGLLSERSLRMDGQISLISKQCIYQLRHIGRIRILITVSACNTFVCSLVTSRLDYGNALLYGLNSSSLSRLYGYEIGLDTSSSRNAMFAQEDIIS